MPGTTVFVPGRIEVLGKHTDYAGGRSLLAAIDRGFTVTAGPAAGDRITIHDTGRRETIEPVPGDLARSHPPLDPEAGSALPSGDEPGWSIYARAVVGRVAADFPGRRRGCRIELVSDLPAAAGLSSSSALITGLFLGLDAVCRFSDTERYRRGIGRPALGGQESELGTPAVDRSGPTAADGSRIPSREALAGYLGAMERGSLYPGLGDAGPAGVGTRGGSQDHVAMLCAQPGALVRYSFEPVRREGVFALPDGYRFVVGASGVVAEKKGAARERYNRLSDLAARAAELWRHGTGGDHAHLGAILEQEDLEEVLQVLADNARPEERDAVVRRVRHFELESCRIIPAATAALATGDLEGFGELVDRSQAEAEALLGNQVPETVHLARSARELGAVAASAFGAGFGGSVWALVPGADADAFTAAWRRRYRDAFPGRAAAASFFTTPAASPARTL